MSKDKKNHLKAISFRTDIPEVIEFLEACSKVRKISQTGLIEIALQFLMEWPEEELDQIIGKSASQERLHALVEEYVAAYQGAGEPR